jgi:hypothetical protein
MDDTIPMTSAAAFRSPAGCRRRLAVGVAASVTAGIRNPSQGQSIIPTTRQSKSLSAVPLIPGMKAVDWGAYANGMDSRCSLYPA